MADTLVSIIIPVFNRRNVLKRALNSVLSQTFQHFEVLVIDDFSTDNPEEVINKFNDERIKYYRLEKKGNANVARNLGIRKAKGEYIAMLDSDDEFLPHHLERRLKKINEWGCDGIFGSAKVFHPNFYTYKISRAIKKGEKMINYLLSDGFAPTPSFFFKRNCVHGVMWNEDLKRHQDYDFLVRLSPFANFRSDPEPTIIIHWEGNKESYHFDSCVKFISTFKEQIAPDIYNNYHAKLLWFAKNERNKKYIKHYEKEAVRHPKYLSLSEFLNSPRKRKFPFVIFYKIKFGLVNFF